MMVIFFHQVQILFHFFRSPCMKSMKLGTKQPCNGAVCIVLTGFSQADIFGAAAIELQIQGAVLFQLPNGGVQRLLADIGCPANFA